MITCTPQGICSWNYALTGDGHYCDMEIRWARETGRLLIDGESLDIFKEGFISPRFSLIQNGNTLFQASRESVFSSRMNIEGASGFAALERDSLFGRSMRLTGAGCDCLIRPAHAFTRRATIEGSWTDLRLVVFGFWLTAMMWRRQSQSAAANSGA